MSAVTLERAARGIPTGVAVLVAGLVVALVAALTLPVLTLPVLTLSAVAPPAAATAASSAAIDPAVRAALASDGAAQVIVRAAPGALPAIRDAITATGGQVLLELDIIDGISARLTGAGLGAITGLEGLHSVVRDGGVELSHTTTKDGALPADARFAKTVRADRLAKDGYDGAGVGIAVIDTGVSPVADLDGRLVGGIDLSGEGDGVDRYGHGTFVAGIAAGNGTASGGKYTGVAPGANVIPVKIAGANGVADVSHVLAAIQYVVSHKDEYGIGVLNLSLGTDSEQSYRLSPLNYAVERAWDAGIVVVVAAGNNGEKGAGHIPKPADDPLVITVGATDGNDKKGRKDDTVAGYSSRGPSIADGIQKPDLVAPGSHLVSSSAPGSFVATQFPDSRVAEGYQRGSGTSFAAAVTSGAVALLRQAHPDWSPDQIKGALLATAAPGPAGDRSVDGHGLLDIDAASHLKDPPVANVGVERSSGLGSLSADRSPTPDDPVADGEVPEVEGIVLDGETTAQGLTFDPQRYIDADWTTAGWYGTDWATAGWYTAGWYTAGWYTAGWYTAGWYTAGWYTAGWYTAGWYTAGWYTAGWYTAGWY